LKGNHNDAIHKLPKLFVSRSDLDFRASPVQQLVVLLEVASTLLQIPDMYHRDCEDLPDTEVDNLDASHNASWSAKIVR
jgi:hypothetical protein